MKNYRINLNGERYTIQAALTAADKTWDDELQVHSCNGIKRLTIYEYNGNRMVKELTVQQVLTIINR